jgi:hypothetical protein
VTTSSELIGTWKVTSTQAVTNVSVESTSHQSRITFSGPTGGPLSCSVSVTPNNFVTNAGSNILPVQWEAASFSQPTTGAGFTGTVDSANGTKHHPVLITFANGILTCEIDPDDSPGSLWTGTHP